MFTIPHIGHGTDMIHNGFFVIKKDIIIKQNCCDVKQAFIKVICPIDVKCEF